ncbi:MAG: prepilin peptidase [Bacillota bacterium]|nr:prepilin peptidase [Bacillota bacterium]
MIVDILFILILAAIAVVDYMTKSIYDMMLIVGALICYPLLYFFRGVGMTAILYGAIWGFGSYLCIYLVAKWIYKDEVFGQGDVLLNAFICGYLGLIPGIIASFLTFFVALVLVLFQWLKSGKWQSDLEIPLAPAMAISAVISMLFYQNIVDFILYI